MCLNELCLIEIVFKVTYYIAATTPTTTTTTTISSPHTPEVDLEVDLDSASSNSSSVDGSLGAGAGAGGDDLAAADVFFTKRGNLLKIVVPVLASVGFILIVSAIIVSLSFCLCGDSNRR